MADDEPMSASAYQIPLSDSPRERRLPQFKSLSGSAPEYDFAPVYGAVVNLHGSGGWDVAKDLSSLGLELTLERDLENEHDLNAVSVIASCEWGPERIGFLDRETAAGVATKLDLGYPLVAVPQGRPWAGRGSKGGSMSLEIRLKG